MGARAVHCAVAALSLVAALLGVQAAAAPAAQASDCLGVWAFKLCGHAFNDSGAVLVAASFDKHGGSCPPFTANPYEHCGTCAIPPGSNSMSRPCASVFKDADAVAFAAYPWRVEDVHGRVLSVRGPKQYVQFSDYDEAHCGGSPASGFYCKFY